jgi:hypothetical protein
MAHVWTDPLMKVVTSVADAENGGEIGEDKASQSSMPS